MRVKYHIFIKNFTDTIILKDPQYKLSILDSTAETIEEARQVAEKMKVREQKAIQKKAATSYFYEKMWERIKGDFKTVEEEGLKRQPLTFS